MKVNDFIMCSKFASLKNDDTGIISVTIPNSITLNPGELRSYTGNLTIGTPSAQMRFQIMTSVDGKWVPSSTLYMMLDMAQAIQAFCYVWKSSPTNVRLTVAIFNPYNYSVTMSGVGRSVSARVATFLNPFS